MGKSTALAAWLRTVPGPTAWYSVDESDNEVHRFWSYALAGLAEVAGEESGVGRRSQRLLAAPGTSVLDDVVPVLVNELCACATAVTLVLNDYHLIHDQRIHATLGRLIEHLPPSLSLVVSSRFGPPSTWPISRLRAENILVEIGAKDLRFTRAEAARLLTKEICAPLSDADIDVLYDRTEGWPAGLHLAALSLQGCTDVHGLITAFSGTVRHITDYLMEEVLDRQPPRMRTFLRRTSILGRLSASLCDCVTDADDAADHLHRAEHELQFLTALDNEGSWFRYHHLIADVLQRELQHTEPQLVPVLHRRAAAWHQEHGLPVDAVRHALAAADVATAGDLITTDYFQVANNGQLATVLGWFDAIGEPAVRGDAKLLAARAMTALIANDLSVAKSWIDLAVSVDADTGGQSRADLGAKDALVEQLYSYAHGDMGRALGWSREALRLIPQDQVWHDLSRSNAAFVDTRLNHFDEAVEGHLARLRMPTRPTTTCSPSEPSAACASCSCCGVSATRRASGSTARTTTSASASWTSTTRPTDGTSSRAGSISPTAGRTSLNRSSPGPTSWYAGDQPGWNTSKCSTRWPAHASNSPATATRPGCGPPRIRSSAPARIRDICSARPPRTRRPPRTPGCPARTCSPSGSRPCSPFWRPAPPMRRSHRGST